MKIFFFFCVQISLYMSVVNSTPIYLSVGENENNVELMASLKATVQSSSYENYLSSIIVVWKPENEIRKEENFNKVSRRITKRRDRQRRKRIPETRIIGNQRKLRKQYVLSQILSGIKSHLTITPNKQRLHQ